MADPSFAHLALQHQLADQPVPETVRQLAATSAVELVWRNDLGGLTFRLGDDRYLKWNPAATGIDLDRERIRLQWLAPRHPAPPVLAHGLDDTGAQWLLTATVPGGFAVGDRWRARRGEAIAAIATGLRHLHAIPIDDIPTWATDSWVTRTPASLGPRPPILQPVLVHGDACAPNTLIDDAGRWTGNVDVGDLAVGDPWADLAVASLSLDWNFGEGHQQDLFDAYGIEPDTARIAYYRALWELES